MYVLSIVQKEKFLHLKSFAQYFYFSFDTSLTIIIGNILYSLIGTCKCVHRFEEHKTKQDLSCKRVDRGGYMRNVLDAYASRSTTEFQENAVSFAATCFRQWIETKATFSLTHTNSVDRFRILTISLPFLFILYSTSFKVIYLKYKLMKDEYRLMQNVFTHAALTFSVSNN